MDPISIVGTNRSGVISRPVNQSTGVESEQKSRLKVAPEAGLGRHHGKGRALRIFRQEAIQSLLAHFRNTLHSANQATSPYADFAAADHTATDILSVARNVLELDSESTTQTILKIRQQVEQAVSATLEIISENDDIDAVDDAAQIVDDGLTTLADQAPLATSTSSFTSIDSRTLQQSTIRIQTQEGDIVKFDLRRVDSLSATDIAVSNADGSSSFTEVLLSSSSRLVLKVDGDLNEAELAAIQSIFEQAEALANEFFSGDIVAAFDLAASLEIDAEQLARVGLRFRASETTRISQSVLQELQPTLASDTVDEALAPQTETAPVAESDDAEIPSPTGDATAIPAEDVTPIPADNIASSFDAIFAFLDSVAGYLNEITDSFDNGRIGDGDSSSIKIRFSQSFRIEILKAAFLQIAPDPAPDSLDLAIQVIDTVGAESEQD